METTSATRAERMLDDRGAVVLMGVFMASFLVGGLWFVMGIGDAAIHRQSLQNTADASAYIAAVYHARGMNIIAMVNLIMGAVMAIAAAAHMVKMVAGIVMTAAAVMCELSKQPSYVITLPNGDSATIDYSSWSWTCEAAKKAEDLWSKMVAVIDQVNKNQDDLLISLSDAQKEVARTAPWIGSSMSSTVVSEQKSLKTTSVAASMSMDPPEDGGRIGLPVQDIPFSKVCKMGGIFVREIVQSSIPSSLDFFVGKLVDELMSDIPDDLCDGATVGNTGTWNFFKEEDVCGEKTSKIAKDQCKADLAGNNPQVPQVTMTFGGEKKDPKQVFGAARNGDHHFQVYGTVTATDTSLLERANKGVEIPAWGKATVASSGEMEAIAVAQAEFYYDQTPAALAEDLCFKKAGCGLTWEEYKAESLWNLRWRARLRRFRPPPPDAKPNVLETGVATGGMEMYAGDIGTFNSFASAGTATKMWESTEIADKTGAGALIGAGTPVIH